MKKILISGYYGFDNFGDDAILSVITSDIKENIVNPEITAISNNPDKIRQNYDISSVYKFNLKDIMLKMASSDIFISGGGSLLQDITSLQSLFYYLGLIFLAKLFRKKTYIYAQGIGPINNKYGLLLAKNILGKTDQITVRDKDSLEFLKGIGISSVLTADPVWGIKVQNKEEKPEEKKAEDEKIKIGIQLREWHSLDDKKLKNLANAVSSNFYDPKYQIILISLQDSIDLEITKKFERILRVINPSLDIEISSGNSISENISIISSLNFLIGMRFHADLISIKFNIPTLAISYDPKVESLAKESGIPYIQADIMDKNELNGKIQELLNNKDKYLKDLKEFSSKKELESRQNIDLLVKMLVNN